MENIKISTHTPVRVWPSSFLSASKNAYISTHTPVRVWPALCLKLLQHLRISTHTPVRVWPIINQYRNMIPCHFNSHTREGVTVCGIFDDSTVVNFNSHTREGVTWDLNWINQQFGISTHTPVRVWQPAIVIFLRLLSAFQLTHPWGCDIKTSECSDIFNHFNSHTREGVTLLKFSTK